MRRLFVCLSLAPVLLITLATVFALAWLRDSPAEFDTLTPLAAPKDAGQPDDILLENPRTLALALGSCVTRAKLPLPDDAKMEQLAKTNPIAFFKYCLRRYDYTVQGYELTFKKQERIGGKLQPSETIAVKFREEPFSVLFEWLKGERLAKKTLFVRGENDNKLLVKPAGVLSLAGIVERDPEGEQAKQSGRYPLTEFGLKIGTLRTVAACEMARKNKALHVEYLGQQKIPEVGERVCYVLKRAPYEKPEEDGIVSATYYVDKETWLQVGSTLKNADGELIAEYWFRDIKLNPPFKPDTFMRKSLK
jgi:Protein of unknown function (DUF1571)